MLDEQGLDARSPAPATDAAAAGDPTRRTAAGHRAASPNQAPGPTSAAAAEAASQVRKINGPGHRADRPDGSRRQLDPQAGGPGGGGARCSCCSCCAAAGVDGRSRARHRAARAAARGRVRGGGARCARRPGRRPQRIRSSTTAPRCRPATTSSQPTSSARSAGSKRPAASTGPRRELDADAIAATHARYAAERVTGDPRRPRRPRPFGGVGGTRVGVKCLHAHVAHLLATGDDVVGRVDARPDRPEITTRRANGPTVGPCAIGSRREPRWADRHDRRRRGSRSR